MNPTGQETLFEKIRQGISPEYLLYSDEMQIFVEHLDLTRLRALPPLPFGAGHPFLTALCGATVWGAEEDGAVRFFCYLAKLHTSSPESEKYARGLTDIVVMSRKLDLEEKIANGDEIIRVMVETEFSPVEIATIYNTRVWNEGPFVPLTNSAGPDHAKSSAPPLSRFGASLSLEKYATNGSSGPYPFSGPDTQKTSSIERYLLGLPDGEIIQVLDALQGHIHLLESVARERTRAARAWLSARALESVAPPQIKALIRGSGEFDPDAVKFVRISRQPAAAAPVVWQLSQLRPSAHQALRQEYYQKPEIAVDADVSCDLVSTDPKSAIRLLRIVLEKKLYESHPHTYPFCYRPVYAEAAKTWDDDAKALFLALVKTDDVFGMQAGLDDLLEHAPADADGDFDAMLIRLCFSEASSGFLVEMLNLVASKRPGRMMDGWWQVLDSDLKEGRQIAGPALAAGLGTKAIPGVLERLTSAKTTIRMGAIAVLSHLGDGKAVQILQEHLVSEQNQKVRDFIYEGLKRLGAATTLGAVDPAQAAQVLAGIEAGFTKKLAKAKLPPGDWWRVNDLSGLKALDGSPVSPKVSEYLVFEHSRLKIIETAPDTLPLIACLDKTSAADFALALLNAWLGEGQDAKHRWVLALAGTLGDSRVISTLLPWIPKWCEAARHKLAEYAAQGISLLGSNEALMVLDTLATRYRSKFRNVGAAAAAAFQAAAEVRGISPDELGDLVVPSFEFNEDGQRRFEWDGGGGLAHLTMDLKLEWSDPDTGKSWKNLPASAPEAVKAEVKELGKLLRETGKAQALRLEQALVKQRRWPVAAWQELYEKHPLLRAYATRLVWGVYTADGTFQRAFRRYPNGILADAAGAMEELPEGDVLVGLLHPLDLDSAALTAWLAHLARFKVQPPFPQLDRPVEHLSPELHNRRTLATADGGEISYSTFRSRAEKRGMDARLRC